jgi:chromosome segregation ATPase
MNNQMLNQEKEFKLQKEQFEFSIDEISENLKNAKISLEIVNNNNTLLSKENEELNEKVNDLNASIIKIEGELFEEKKQHAEIIENTNSHHKNELDSMKNSSNKEIVQLEEKFAKVLEEALRVKCMLARN